MKSYRSLFIVFILVIPGLKALSQTPVKSSISHIAIAVADLERSKDFYEKVLQLDSLKEPFHDGKHKWFKVAEHTQLHLIQISAKKQEHDINTHLCFSVPSIEEFMGVLRNNKIQFRDWAGNLNVPTLRVDGVKQIYFQDPDGYWIEVNNEKL